MIRFLAPLCLHLGHGYLLFVLLLIFVLPTEAFVFREGARTMVMLRPSVGALLRDRDIAQILCQPVEQFLAEGGALLVHVREADVTLTLSPSSRNSWALRRVMMSSPRSAPSSEVP